MFKKREKIISNFFTFILTIERMCNSSAIPSSFAIEFKTTLQRSIFHSLKYSVKDESKILISTNMLGLNDTVSPMPSFLFQILFERIKEKDALLVDFIQSLNKTWIYKFYTLWKEYQLAYFFSIQNSELSKSDNSKEKELERFVLSFFKTSLKSPSKEVDFIAAVYPNSLITLKNVLEKLTKKKITIEHLLPTFKKLEEENKLKLGTKGRNSFYNKNGERNYLGISNVFISSVDKILIRIHNISNSEINDYEYDSEIFDKCKKVVQNLLPNLSVVEWEMQKCGDFRTFLNGTKTLGRNTVLTRYEYSEYFQKRLLITKRRGVTDER